MIVIKNRELLIPNNEQFIGTVYDNNADTRFFKIDRVLPGQIDLNNFTFVADVKYSNNATDSISLTKDSVTEEYIVLRMQLPASVLSSHVGNMAIQVRCSDTAGRTWSTAPANMYIMDQISNPGAVTSSTTLTELQQTETTIEASETLRIAAETSRANAETGRVNAESARVLAESGRATAETGRVSAEGGRASAETGRVNAETARGNAETGRSTAESLRVIAEASRVNAESARVVAETARDAAETARETAEAAREASLATKSLVSEGWAKGTQNDVPVTSESPYYHDNSKYHKEQSAADALVSEGWAKGTQNGVEVTSESPYYHDNSKYYKEQAGQATVGFVSYATEQDLNATAKARARGNIDAYTKPASGIPSTDLTSAVQTSLGKADTALQEHQSLAAYQQKTDADLTTTAQTVVGAINEHETDISSLSEDKANKTDVHPLINIWDEQWENGYIDVSTGQDVSSSSYSRCVGFVKCKPSTEYYGYCSTNPTNVVLFYGSSKNYLSYESGKNRVFTTPNNCYYLRFYFDNNYYNSDISINYPSTYHGYYPSALPKEIAERKDEDFMITMDGFISPTINGIKNYWDGSLYHRRIARVDLGSLEWAYDVSVGYNEFSATIPNGKFGSDWNNTISYCTKYASNPSHKSYTTMPDKSFLYADMTHSGSIPKVIIKDSTYTDALSFKQAVSGTFLYYEITEQTCNIDANGLRFELLWENASPSASFGEQSINLDLSKYSCLFVTFRQSNISYIYVSLFMRIDSNNYKVSGIDGGSSLITYYRHINASYRIDFSQCYYSVGAGAETTDNNYCIPYRIYGVR